MKQKSCVHSASSMMRKSITYPFLLFSCAFFPCVAVEVSYYNQTFSSGVSMKQEHAFEAFLQVFVPEVARKTKQANQALWILETTGSQDAAHLKAQLDTELRMLFNDRKVYDQLLVWDQDPLLQDPLLKRQLNILIRGFKGNLIPKALLEEITQKEAALSQSYANFRPEFEGKAISDNGIREILKKENDPKRRQEVWNISKKIGDVLAPQVLALVHLRNQAAKSLGYKDYFQMQLDLQEVDSSWLLRTLDDLAERSDATYSEMLKSVEKQQATRFGVSTHELGPWAWSEPFCQEDPLSNDGKGQDLDSLVTNVDISRVSEEFYRKMGIDVRPILDRSDMWERTGKNQHAFCINMDREGDVRTLNNVQSSIKWLETVLHELGHGIYELGFDSQLPWLLREPPHMIPTEAMALLAGRQAYRYDSLRNMLPTDSQKEILMRQADESLKRRQLIFSRWVLVMTFFESELYRDPEQDLNRLWWSAVKKYQKISIPQGREDKNDWATKIHISMAPVYYFSYLLGEMFASSMEETLMQETGSTNLTSEKAGDLLQERLFKPGNRMSWGKLVEHVTGAPLSPDAWLRQFANSTLPAE